MSQIRNPAENMRSAAIFVRVGESGSFSSAAQTLGMSASGVSKAISRLEARLAVRLLHRTTRSVSLTDEGEAYFERCRSLIRAFEEAEAELATRTAEPRGSIRIQLPRGFGRRVVLPALEPFLNQYRQLAIDASLDGHILDLAEEGIDVALRFGKPPESRIVARKLCRVNYLLCASPAYIERNGPPRSIEDLFERRRISYVRPETGKARIWMLGEGPNTIPVAAPGAIILNDIYAVVEAAVSGLGIAYIPDFMAATELEADRLRVVLPQYLHEGPSLYMLYRQRTLPPRIRVFVDFIASFIPREPAWYVSALAKARRQADLDVMATARCASPRLVNQRDEIMADRP
jgi:LysR family transcriptional regulator for bpeEF and oprC